MRDVHSHILPGLDNGPRTMSGSLMMLSAAMNAGVTSIVCTPHCHDSRFQFEPAWQAFLQLKHRASAIPGAPQLTMGFEVGYHKLKSLGMDAAPNLGNAFGEFLLELPEGALPIDWEHVVHQLQHKGFRVVIAHPERSHEVQADIQIARRFVNAGCQLQISARNIEGGFLNAESRTAKKLVQAGLVEHIASEAHNPDDYELFAEAWEFYGMQPPAAPPLRQRQVATAASQQRAVAAPASIPPATPAAVSSASAVAQRPAQQVASAPYPTQRSEAAHATPVADVRPAATDFATQQPNSVAPAAAPATPASEPSATVQQPAPATPAFETGAAASQPKTRAQRVAEHLQQATQSQPDPNARPYTVSTQPSHARPAQQPGHVAGVVQSGHAPKHGKHAR